MTKRKAMFMVCDEILITLSGKLFTSGAYTGDIAIAGAEANLPQLTFLFLLEISTKETFPMVISTHITMPGLDMVTSEKQFVLAIPPEAQARDSFIFHLPMMVQNVVARPGPINAKIVFPDGDLSVGSHMIVGLHPQMQAKG